MLVEPASGSWNVHISTHVAISSDTTAAIAQLGERQTEDLKVPGSIPGLGMQFYVELLWACAYCSAIHWFLLLFFVVKEISGKAATR